MMNRFEPGDLRTGVLVIGAVILLVIGVIWGNTSKVQDLSPLYVEMPSLVGVTTETPVMLNGFKVGQVDDVAPQIDADGHLTFRVRMMVAWHPGGGSAIPYRQGMKVRLNPPPIEQFGSAIIRLEPPKVASRALPPGAMLPLIPYVSPLDNAQVRVDSIAREMTRTLSQTRQLLAGLAKTANAATLTANATTGVATVASEQLAALASDTRDRLRLVDSLMRDARSVTPKALATADSLQALLGDSRKAIARLSRMADANEPQLTRTLASLDTSSALLQHFMREVSAKPMRVLTGVSPLPAGAVPGAAARGGETVRP